MISNSFFQFDFEGLAGILIAIVGIWLVIRQLAATRQVSHMDALLQLNQAYIDISKDLNVLSKLANSDHWKSLSEDKALALIKKSEEYHHAYNNAFGLFELMGMLAKRKVLDEKMALDLWGPLFSLWWTRVGHIVEFERKKRGWTGHGKHWEWLAKRYEDKQ